MLPCITRLKRWLITLWGQGHTFTIDLSLPIDYTFKPPTLSFATRIYHPNVTNDDKGSMCLGMLKSDQWKPSSKIAAVLEFARQLLSEPMPDDAVEGRIAEQYNTDRAAFNKAAKEAADKWAKWGVFWLLCLSWFIPLIRHFLRCCYLKYRLNREGICYRLDISSLTRYPGFIQSVVLVDDGEKEGMIYQHKGNNFS